MYIPRKWIRTSASSRTPDGREFPVSTWGWGDDEGSAKKEATKRLQRLLERIGRGEPFPDSYAYGRHPVKEEILEVVDGEVAGEPAAIVTRNGYGVQVLNTARLLFLDIDLQPSTVFQRLLHLIGLGPDFSEQAVLARLRDVLKQQGRTTFRIYRTASGLRVMAVDREFDPAGREARELMEATDTDPAFTRLCIVQRSFRARLTPKPWRCNCSPPPGKHPRDDEETRRRFASWLAEYEKTSTGFATCRYLETIGSGRPRGSAGKLLDIHDRVTRCTERLALA